MLPLYAGDKADITSSSYQGIVSTILQTALAGGQSWVKSTHQCATSRLMHQGLVL
jgi:hypothetical protein